MSAAEAISLIGTVLTALLGLWLRSHAAREEKRLVSIHILVNSSMSAQLKTNAVLARRLAVLLKTPEDVAAADLAEKLSREHEIKQAAIDVSKGV